MIITCETCNGKKWLIFSYHVGFYSNYIEWRGSLVKMSDTRTRTCTCNGWPQKWERKDAMEPAHDYTVLITPFWCQEWSKSFVKGGGFGSKATCSRHHNWSKGSEFNLPDPLAISMPLCILMVSISSRNRIYIRGGKRIKNSRIHKTVYASIL